MQIPKGSIDPARSSLNLRKMLYSLFIKSHLETECFEVVAEAKTKIFINLKKSSNMEFVTNKLISTSFI